MQASFDRLMQLPKCAKSNKTLQNSSEFLVLFWTPARRKSATRLVCALPSINTQQLHFQTGAAGPDGYISEADEILQQSRKSPVTARCNTNKASHKKELI